MVVEYFEKSGSTSAKPENWNKASRLIKEKQKEVERNPDLSFFRGCGPDSAVKFGFEYERFINIQKEDLVNLLKNHGPVIFFRKDRREAAGHAVVVTGLNSAGEVCYHDPLEGPAQRKDYHQMFFLTFFTRFLGRQPAEFWYIQ